MYILIVRYEFWKYQKIERYSFSSIFKAKEVEIGKIIVWGPVDRIGSQKDLRKELPMRSDFFVGQNSEIGYFFGSNLFEFFGGTISPSSVLIDCDLIDSDIDFRNASVGFL